MTAPKISLAKKLIFYSCMIGIPLIFIEAAVRTYFAFQIGPRVWLYGTTYSRYQEKFDPKGAVARKLREEETVAFHENITHDYSKYFPHQKLLDRDEFGRPITVSINSRGFRGNEFERNKPPGVVRIITLGASSTFGFKSDNDETYPFQLERLLNRALSELNLRRATVSARPIAGFEVINLGVPHLRAEQIYSLLVNEGLELSPDFVTFYEGINDAAWEAPGDTSTERTKQTIKAVPFANEVFRELRYRLLSVALVGMMISQVKVDYADADVRALRQGKVEHFIKVLQRINEACHRSSCTLILANQQARSIDDRDRIKGLRYLDEQAMVQEKLAKGGRVSSGEAFFLVHKDLMDAERQWAVANHIPFANVIGAMDLERQHLVTWVHLNVAGNLIVASVLADVILRQLGGSDVPAKPGP